MDPPPKGKHLSRGLLLIALLAAFADILYNNYYVSPSDTSSIIAPEHIEPFAVVDLPGKGKGVIAARDINQGELILRDSPLFIVPPRTASPTTLILRSLRDLSDDERESFYDLSFVNFPADREPEDYPEDWALAIFQTNAVAAGAGVGLFPRMARLNHGCSRAFNAVYTWRERERAIFVHALKSIRKGQEILTTYTDTKRPRDQRRKFLSEHYGFHCTCDTCSLADLESQASDARLTEMSSLYRELASWGQNTIDGTKAISIVQRIWALGEEEGYWSERGRLAADAAWVAAAHSDAKATSSWAELSAVWYAFEVGGDSEQVSEMRALVLHPLSHSSWGTREHMNVGGPDLREGFVKSA